MVDPRDSIKKFEDDMLKLAKDATPKLLEAHKGGAGKSVADFVKKHQETEGEMVVAPDFLQMVFGNPVTEDQGGGTYTHTFTPAVQAIRKGIIDNPPSVAGIKLFDAHTGEEVNLVNVVQDAFDKHEAWMLAAEAHEARHDADQMLYEELTEGVYLDLYY